MPPSKSSKTAVKRKTAANSRQTKEKVKPPKGKERASAEKSAPKENIPHAVLEHAKKRKFSLAEESDDEVTPKPAKKRKNDAPRGFWAHDAWTAREMPPAQDYGTKFAKKSTAHSTWGVSLPPQLPRAIAESQYTDRVSKTTAKAKSKLKGKQAACQSAPGNGFSRRADSVLAVDDDTDVETKADRIKLANVWEQNRNSNLLKLPLEVRENIYAHLLVADNPIQVRKGWSAVYKRKRPNLDISILFVCRQTRNEAINVLYGENTFLYLLRDPISPAETHAASENEIVVQHPSLAAGVRPDECDNSDSEYSDEELLPQARTAQGTDVEIDIRRYGHKFRHIKLVADHNRLERGYLLSMAKAISVFRDLRPLRPRINTISFEITPKRDNTTGELGILDFFDKSSEAIKALRGLPCQHVNVIVNVGEEKQEVIHINMKYAALIRRARRGKDDVFQGDGTMEAYAHQQAGDAQAQLDELPASIQRIWEKHNGQVTEVQGSDDEDIEGDEVLWGQDYE